MKTPIKIIILLLNFVFIHQSSFCQNIRANNELKILSWNVYMLPAAAHLSKSIIKSDKLERAEQISDIMNASDYDIIVFQETFHMRSRKKLAKNLKEAYPYQYGPINKSFITANSGIFIVSKIPLKQLGKIRYDDCNSSDCLARKGSALFEGELNGKTFQILGTHLNSTREQEIRELQYEQLFNELIEPHQKEGVPLFICGDLNTRQSKPEAYNSMLKKLDAEDVKTLGKRKHTTVTDKVIIDYILIRRNNAQVEVVDKQIRKFEAKTEMIDKLHGTLSDHLAVELTIIF